MKNVIKEIEVLMPYNAYDGLRLFYTLTKGKSFVCSRFR